MTRFDLETIHYPSSNGQSTVSATLYVPTDCPVTAVLQISHGMCEYFDRYAQLAEFLCGKGFVVCGNDHIGHRHSVSHSGDLGFFGPRDGWKFLVEDVHAFTQLMKERFPDAPYFLLGHSMGSFIARLYLSSYGAELDGAILSGTGGPNPLAGVGVGTADLLCRVQGPRKRSAMLQQMAFGSYNDRFEKRTKMDWLSRDQDVVDAYLADPYCTFRFTNAGFRDLFTLTQQANRPQWASTLPQDLPLYLFSGQEDPVGDYGKGVQKVYRMLKDAGLFDVTLKLYPDGRHEMLNELNQEQVRQDLYDWLRRKII